MRPHDIARVLADQLARLDDGLAVAIHTPLGRPVQLRVTAPGHQITELIDVTAEGPRWAWGEPIPGQHPADHAAIIRRHFPSSQQNH